MQNSSYYKREAKLNLKGNWFMAIIICIIVTAVSPLLALIPVVGSIIGFIVMGQVNVGQIQYFNQLTARESAGIGDFFKDFFKNLGGNFFTYFLVSLFTTLWSLLLIIPGIIKSYSYSMALYLRARNPELLAGQAITLSRQIMNGKKFRLFCLHFSFFGWMLLSIITLGLGLLFVVPYMQAATNKFFEDAYNDYYGNVA